MPLWIYWALFFAVIGVSLLAAAWLDAREGASTAAVAARPAAKPAQPFERPAPRAIEAIDAPPAVDPFALTLEIDRSHALEPNPAESPPAKREDDGPTRE